MVMRVVSITSVSICQVSKHFFFVTQHVFQFVKNERLSSSLIRIFKEIFVKLVLLLKPSAVEYVVRENQNRTAKWVRHNRVKIFLRADLFRFSCTDVFTRYTIIAKIKIMLLRNIFNPIVKWLLVKVMQPFFPTCP